jgi:hypothetical protein
MKLRYNGMNAVQVCTLGIGLSALAAAPAFAGDVDLNSPGLAGSRMDDRGGLVEDWGRVGIKVDGEGITPAEPKLAAVKLDGVIPAAECVWKAGAVDFSATAFRAPAWPAGMDVLTVTLRLPTAKSRRKFRLSCPKPSASAQGP